MEKCRVDLSYGLRHAVCLIERNAHSWRQLNTLKFSLVHVIIVVETQCRCFSVCLQFGTCSSVRKKIQPLVECSEMTCLGFVKCWVRIADTL